MNGEQQKPILEMRGVSKQFLGVKANDRVDKEVVLQVKSLSVMGDMGQRALKGISFEIRKHRRKPFAGSACPTGDSEDRIENPDSRSKKSTQHIPAESSFGR